MFVKIWQKNGKYYQSKRITFSEQCIEVNINKVVITILQVTKTVLGGLTI